MLVRGKSHLQYYTVSGMAKAHTPSVPSVVSCPRRLFLPLSPSPTHTFAVSDGHNSKVTGALERVVSYHTSVVQHSSQVRRDAVGSACWCKHAPPQRTEQSKVICLCVIVFDCWQLCVDLCMCFKTHRFSYFSRCLYWRTLLRRTKTLCAGITLIHQAATFSKLPLLQWLVILTGFI